MLAERLPALRLIEPQRSHAGGGGGAEAQPAPLDKELGFGDPGAGHKRVPSAWEGSVPRSLRSEARRVVRGQNRVRRRDFFLVPAAAGWARSRAFGYSR